MNKIQNLLPFISPLQWSALASGCQGEERNFFLEKIAEYSDRVVNMSKVYDQDGKGDNAIVHLHYFYGSCDWYITERDFEDEQHQAFGYADLGYGGELGYISIEELKQNNIEMDLHWTPKTLGEVKKTKPTYVVVE